MTKDEFREEMQNLQFRFKSNILQTQKSLSKDLKEERKMKFLQDQLDDISEQIESELPISIIDKLFKMFVTVLKPKEQKKLYKAVDTEIKKIEKSVKSKITVTLPEDEIKQSPQQKDSPKRNVSQGNGNEYHIKMSGADDSYLGGDMMELKRVKSYAAHSL